MAARSLADRSGGREAFKQRTMAHCDGSAIAIAEIGFSGSILERTRRRSRQGLSRPIAASPHSDRSPSSRKASTFQRAAMASALLSKSALAGQSLVVKSKAARPQVLLPSMLRAAVQREEVINLDCFSDVCGLHRPANSRILPSS